MRTRASLAAIALILIAAVRIASTFRVFSVTVDEPMHVSAGLQLYTQHDYSYQPANPPLPRLVFALAPWLGGMKFDPQAEVTAQLPHVFHSRGQYARNLTLARVGNLVFFAIAAVAVWVWARGELGDRGGLIAVLLFTMEPVVLGYCGLATHDASATAGFAVCLVAFARWMDNPDVSRAALFGVAFAFATLCKFSLLVYVPAACLAMYIVRAIRSGVAWRRILPSLLIAAAVATAIVGGVYLVIGPRFFMAGIRELIHLDRSNMFVSYLFGKLSWSGFRSYFPIAVSLKTTIPALLLAVCAFAARRHRVAAEALAACAAVFLVAMPSTLNLGVRYVLPLYAAMSVAGAAAATMLFASRHRLVPIATAALLLWHCGESVAVHPDYFPYFNELAGPRPWLCLVDSNIDWGQDVIRLRRVVRAKHVDRIGLAIMGWHDWGALGFPPNYTIQREVPAQGWVAVSEHLYGVARGAPWLEGRRYERVGKSIRLYYIP